MGTVHLSLAEGLIVVLVATTFTLPARLVFPPLGAAGAPAMLMGLGLALLWLLTFLRPRSDPAGANPVRWLVLFLFLTSLGAYISGQVRGLPEAESSSSDRALLSTIALCGVTLATSEAVQNRRNLRTLLTVLVGFGVFQAFVAYLQYFLDFDIRNIINVPGLQPNHELLGTEIRGEGVSRIAGTMTHYIELGVVLALLMPIALHMMLFAQTVFRRRLFAVATLLIVTAIPLSVSRSGLVALIVGLLFTAVVWPPARKASLALTAGIGLVLYPVVAPGVLGTLRALFLNTDVDPSVAGRTADYDQAAPYFTDRPVLGRGLGTFIPSDYFYLDNEYLMRALNGGVVAVLGIALLFIGAYAIGRSIRRRAPLEEDRHLGQALAATMVSAAVASAFFDSTSFTGFAITIFLLVGLTGALWRLSGAQPRLSAVMTTTSRVASPWWGDLPLGRPRSTGERGEAGSLP